MEVIYTEPELACVKAMAGMFTEGRSIINQEDLSKASGVAIEKLIPILGTLESHGLIANVIHFLGKGGQFGRFSPTAESVQVARQIEQQTNERTDIVAKVQERARKHPLWAWIIVGAAVLTLAFTLVNQFIELLKNFGVLQLAKLSASEVPVKELFATIGRLAAGSFIAVTVGWLGSFVWHVANLSNTVDHQSKVIQRLEKTLDTLLLDSRKTRNAVEGLKPK